MKVSNRWKSNCRSFDYALRASLRMTLLEWVRAIGATTNPTAGSFDKLRTGSSTALITKYVSNFAHDDNLVGRER